MPTPPVYASDYNSDLTTLETNYGTQFDNAPDDQLVYLAQRDFCDVYYNAVPPVAEWDTVNCLTSYMGCTITWTTNTSIIKIEKGDYSLTQDVMNSILVKMGDNWTYGDEVPIFSNTIQARLNSYFIKSDYTSELDSKKIRRKQLNNMGWEVSSGDVTLKTGSFVSIDEDCFIAESDELLFQGGSSSEYKISTATYDIVSADYDGEYYVVLETGAIPHSIWYTTDPTGTWTERTITEGVQKAKMVKYFSETGYWYIVGDDGLILRTTDPTGTWTDLSISTGYYDLNCIEYGNSMYMIGGGNITATGCYFYTSTNGTTFTTHTMPTTGTEIGDMNALKYHNGTWVSGHNYGTISYTTDDGANWTYDRKSGSSSSWIYDVTYDEINNYWLFAAGYLGGVKYSSDLITWTSATLPNWTSYKSYAVKYYNGTIYSSGRDGYLAYCSNPSGTWIEVTTPSTRDYWGMYYGSGGLLIGVDDGYVYYRIDGLSVGSYIYFNGTNWETSLTEEPIYDANKGGYFHPDKVNFYNYRCIAYWDGSIMDPVKIKRGEIY